MEMKKILWPTDFSDRSEQALPYVKSLTEKYNTEIHVLYVIEDIAHHKPWYGEIEQSHIQKCPLYIKHVAVGDPAQEILSLIENEKVDTVVLSTRGEKGNFRFGSVAEKVVKNSPVPVVTIPTASEA
jgi:nucleotide-binding universal stress UspA family protein